MYQKDINAENSLEEKSQLIRQNPASLHRAITLSSETISQSTPFQHLNFEEDLLVNVLPFLIHVLDDTCGLYKNFSIHVALTFLVFIDLPSIAM